MAARWDAKFVPDPERISIPIVASSGSGTVVIGISIGNLADGAHVQPMATMDVAGCLEMT